MRADLIATLGLVVVVGACPRTISPDNNGTPVAVAGDDVTALVGAEITFDGSASDDDGVIEAFAWDFGDGSGADGATVTHAFDAAGGYVATLTVTDDLGATASDSVIVRVVDTLGEARFTLTPAVPVVGEPVTLDATGSTSGAALATASWDFGDGNQGTGLVVSHTWTTAGPVTVQLTVTDDAGASATTSASVSVAAAVSSVAGTWDLTAPAFACANYQAAFPDGTLVMTQTGADVVAAGANTRSYTGTVSGQSLRLAGPATAATGGCGTIGFDVVWNATIDSPTQLSGVASAFFDGNLGCACTATWDIVATRR